MYKRKRIFESSIFEETFDQLNEIEQFNKLIQGKSMKTSKCPMSGCSWSGSTKISFRLHVQRRHKQNNLNLLDNIRFVFAFNNLNILTIHTHYSLLLTVYSHNADNFNEEQPMISDDTSINYQLERQDQEELNKKLIAVIGFDINDPTAHMVDTESEISSRFFNQIKEYPKELRRKAFSMFDILIDMRFKESIPESSFSRISSKLISAFIESFGEPFDSQTLDLLKKMKRFVSRLNLQDVYVQSRGNFIKPIQLTINTNGNSIKFQYIPIEKIASMVLGNRSVVAEILREQHLLRYKSLNRFDNELTCEQQRWEAIKGRLRMKLYSDEFSIVNPIGHSKYNQNYIVVYCTFENIPYKDRLKRDDIFLVLIANHKNIDSISLHSLLDQLNTDIRQLTDNGIEKEVKIDDKVSKVIIPFTLSSIVGDAKTAYQFSGYPGGFDIGFVCRMCGADYEEIQSGVLFRPLFGTKIDASNYWKLIDEADDNVFLQENRLQHFYGVARKFKFASKDGLNPWNCMSFDVCHDILEGSMAKIISLVLVKFNNDFVHNKAIIAAIVSGKQFYDAPFSLRSTSGGFVIDGDMIQRAELLIHLEHIFLLDLSEATNVSAETIIASDSFQLYKAFLHIAMISFQCTITQENLLTLQSEILQMFILIKRIDPNFKIFAKLHHITHYPEMIRRFGPLIFFSTLSFERKHQTLKRWAFIMHNSINPAVSMANRHQYHQATQWKSSFKQRSFIYTNSLSNLSSIVNGLSQNATLFSGKPPCSLNKNVVRRVGETKFWLELEQFWTIDFSENKDKDKDNLYVTGNIYEKTDELIYTLPIMDEKEKNVFFHYEDLYHVNDFLFSFENHSTLIYGII